MSSYHPLIGLAVDMVKREELSSKNSKDIIYLRASFLKTDFFLGSFIMLPVTALQPHNEMHWKFLKVLFGKRRTKELLKKVLENKSEEDDDYLGHFRAIEKFSREMRLEEFLRSPHAFTDFE